MDERATGLILRLHPLTETSLIVNWLSPELGRISTVAKGALRTKSPLRGKLDLCFRANFSFLRSRRSDLHNLREVELLETFPELRKSVNALAQAAYMAALIEQTTEKETPLTGIFELAHGFLEFISHHERQPAVVFALEMKLLVELGLTPELKSAKLTESSRHLLEQFVSTDWDMLSRFKMSEGQQREITAFLHGFLIYHLERIPRGRQTAITGL